MIANARPDRWVSRLCGLALCGVVACAGGGGYGAYVETAPPPDRVEVIEVSPGPGHVWVDGRWAWSGGAYVWEPGRWVVPERGHHRWNKGHWQRTRNGWYWVDGRWR